MPYEPPKNVVNTESFEMWDEDGNITYEQREGEIGEHKPKKSPKKVPKSAKAAAKRLMSAAGKALAGPPGMALTGAELTDIAIESGAGGPAAKVGKARIRGEEAAYNEWASGRKRPTPTYQEYKAIKDGTLTVQDVWKQMYMRGDL